VHFGVVTSNSSAAGQDALSTPSGECTRTMLWSRAALAARHYVIAQGWGRPSSPLGPQEELAETQRNTAEAAEEEGLTVEGAERGHR